MQLDPIVSSPWLLDNYANVVVCDVRAYLDGRSGAEAFARGHLPGARFIDLDTVLTSTPAPVLGRHPLPDPADFAAGLSDASIGHDTPVVAYDDAGGMIAGRLVWMLRILGQPAALLDGGIDGWSGELTSTLHVAQPIENAARPWPKHALADANDVEAAIAAGGVVVDSRAAPRYRGEYETIDPKAGHVPGAINLPFTDNLVDGHFASTTEIGDRFRHAGVDANAIFYCGSGVSACNNILAAEAAGLGVGKLYVGSWSGWSSDESRAISTD